ncbi:MAG: ribonuclease Y [Clostridia bacterium]|nr:ribonuclease Y [Clostridia bacterium]
MEFIGFIIAAVIAAAAVIAVIAAYKKGCEKGEERRRQVAEAAIGSAEDEAKRIIENANKAAQTKKKEALLEAKDEIHKARNEADKEIKDRRNEMSRQERRVQQKEETLDKKTEAVEKKEEKLNDKMKELDAQKEKVEQVHQSQLAELERISGITVEEAKQFLLKNVESDVRHEASILIRDVETQAKEEAEKKAKNIIGLAIQKYAADHVAETTVSVVSLPNDDMKGRIIGREGRNIRTIESLTGVELIIDDTPEAVIISGFDPIRREVARIALEKLIMDGRIHPARIEEMVDRAKKEVEATIKQEGEQATFDTGVHGLHPELIKLLGRLKFRTSYGQNVLKHSIEVAHVAGVMAGELGVDVTIAKRAGLLHDIGKAVDHEIEGSHVTIGVDLARKYKESPAVVHAIEAHHGDVEPQTIVACLVQAADAISAARPGARRENIESYIKRLQKLEEIATSFDGVDKSYAIQAGREVRIMVKPEKIGDGDMDFVAREIVKKIESEMEYPGQIKVNIIRETRTVAYAK